MMKTIAVAFAVVLVHVRAADDEWQLIRDGMQAWHDLSFGESFGLAVGDTTGPMFTHNVGRHDMFTTPIAGESLSKFYTTMMVANMVNHGILSFDDKVAKYLDWWQKDPEKPLGGATLRHLLSFTTGFRRDVCYGENSGESSCFCLKGYVDCAEQMYINETKLSLDHHPNMTWSYLSIHLQMAGAMALKAAEAHEPDARHTMQTLLRKYLYTPFGLEHTTYQPFYFPAMAVGAQTPGNDIHTVLQKVLNYEVIPKSIQDQVDFDYSYLVSGSPKGSTDGWWGHYAMGNWVECLGFGIAPKVNPNAAIQPRCKALNIHSFPGGSGVYPLLDRSEGGDLAGPPRNQSYFGLMVQEPEALTGLPEYFRIIAKPVTDVLVGGHELSKVTDDELLHNLGGLIARDIAYIKTNLKTCTCANEARKGEPYISLLEGLPADNSALNRNHILQGNSSGVTLRRLINVSKTLGVCTCEGRHNAAPIKRKW